MIIPTPEVNFTASPFYNPNLKNVVILATGGTIAGSGEAHKTLNYEPGALPIQDLLDSVPHLERVANCIGIQVSNLGSADITSQHWLTLASIINTLAQREDIHGFVITHGTDTLDETSYFLNLVIKTDKPVIITGSMRPATAISPDGPLNLFQSVALAANPEATGQGVMVVFAEGIYSGRDVQKVNTFKANAFDERDFGCLGYMRDSEAFFYTRSLKKHTTASQFDVSALSGLPEVSVAYFHVDADPGILDYLSTISKGIVIAGAGGGIYSKPWIDKVGELKDNNIPVVRCSRISSGITLKDTYIDLSANSIPCNSLVPQKARILLSLALTQTTQYDDIAEMFNVY
ncbi:asparaginase [Paenibacillus sp. FSL R7-0273]|uniref:asparaginase n=1 Tax=Paenibacillus sp. FSL R7-0273 TaxID=1536772 RepID=UPI00063F9995|nr:asparaginase [Paenibacillus sp. FSL R7-0273]OMF94422.1 L-asparaginase [Paenibacillus sp. FSL R7-0273]